MSLYPEENCVLCDLPWKNNRVRYDDRLLRIGSPGIIEFGNHMRLILDRQGVVTLENGSDPPQRIETGYPACDETIAFDALRQILYFASDHALIAYALKERQVAFSVPTQGVAGAPMLFEFLLPDGQPQLTVGFGDGAEHFIAVDRFSGHMIWRAQILGRTADAAAHRNGYLYLALRDLPLQALCLDAVTGELVWWNCGKGTAQCGIIAKNSYCVQDTDGNWQRFSLEDGSVLP